MLGKWGFPAGGSGSSRPQQKARLAACRHLAPTPAPPRAPAAQQAALWHSASCSARATPTCGRPRAYARTGTSAKPNFLNGASSGAGAASLAHGEELKAAMACRINRCRRCGPRGRAAARLPQGREGLRSGRQWDETKRGTPLVGQAKLVLYALTWGTPSDPTATLSSQLAGVLTGTHTKRNSAPAWSAPARAERRGTPGSPPPIRHAPQPIYDRTQRQRQPGRHS